MCPARRGARRGGASGHNVRDSKSKKEEQPPPRLVLNAGAGWTLENYNYVKAQPPEKLTDNIYKIFGIPLLYKTSVEHPAIQIFVEFHQTAFTFAQQFTDTGKALMTLMILTDYIGNVPAFSSSKDSFAQWVERATKVIQTCEFTPAERQLVTSYINNNLRTNAHVLHFVITHEAMKKLDAEGLKLFHPATAPKKENTDEEDAAVPDPNAELEAQLAAAAAAERGAAEEAQRQAELQQAVEAIVTENMTRLKAAVDGRNEKLLQQMLAIEEAQTGKGGRRRANND